MASTLLGGRRVGRVCTELVGVEVIGGTRRKRHALSVLCVLLFIGFGCVGADANVLPDGSFATAVSISVPAFHGLEPRLSLRYSSDAVDGWVGTGWSLAGLSAISRTSEDRGVPRWDASDRFSLDGAELLPCPPAGADPGATSPSCRDALPGWTPYTTRVESYKRVAFRAARSDHPGGIWRVWEPNGIVATYAPGTQTLRGVYDWRLSTVTSAVGSDRVAYHWTRPDDAPPGETVAPVLESITYGDVAIRFISQPRPDPATVATGGELAVNPLRLEAIDEAVGDQRLRAYALRYSTHPAGRSWLASVQEYGSDATVDASGVSGTHSHPPITFAPSSAGPVAWRADPHPAVGWTANWPDGQPDESSAWTMRDPRSDAALLIDHRHWQFADLTGDHVADPFLAYSRKDEPACTHACSGRLVVEDEVTRPDGGGYDFHTTAIASLTYPDRPANLSVSLVDHPFAADLNGDGLQDLAVVVQQEWTNPFDSSTRRRDAILYTALSNGDGTFTATGTMDLPDLNEGDPVYDVADENGDGRADLIAARIRQAGCAGTSVTVALRGTTGLSTFGPATCLPDLSGVQLGDLNGDGRTDVFQWIDGDPYSHPKHDAQLITGFADGAGSFLVTAPFDTGHAWMTQVDRSEGNILRRILTGDVDGDGNTDVVLLQPGLRGGSLAWTLFSRGNGTFRVEQGRLPPHTLDQPPSSGSCRLGCKGTTPHYLTGDFDGDGATDLMVAPPVLGWPNPITVLRLRSQRNGQWQELPEVTRDWSAECPVASDAPPCQFPDFAVAAGDIDGDGRDDTIIAHSYHQVSDATNHEAFIAALSNNSPAARDLLVADTNGDGRQDLVYPITTATGVQIRVLRRERDGTLTPLAPSDVSIDVPHVRQRDWIVMDVNCDGRADLVNVDGRAPLTLLSAADSWRPVRSSELAPQPNGWRVADANDDGCDDLVRVAGGSIQTLLGHSDGTFDADNQPAPGLPTDTLAWAVADTDGDHHPSLVHVNTAPDPLGGPPTGIGVETLLRRDGHWQPVFEPLGITESPPDSPFSPGPAGGGWIAMDANGDTTVDLVQPWFDATTGQDSITTLYSLGNGSWSSRTRPLDLTAADGGPRITETVGWHAISLQLGQRTALTRVWNRDGLAQIDTATPQADGSWLAQRSDPVGGAMLAGRPDMSAWQSGDLAGAQTPTVFRLDHDPDAGLSLNAITASGANNLVTDIDNGVGATTRVGYGSSTDSFPADRVPAASCRLPPGATRVDVTQIHTEDAASHTDDTATVTYDCPTWSRHSHTILAWDTLTIEHPRTAARDAWREQTVVDANPSIDIVHTGSEAVSGSNAVRRTDFRYEPEGNAPPFTDLLASRTEQECDTNADNCITRTTKLTHDADGNVIDSREGATGADGRRQTHTTYNEAHGEPYLVALPREQTIFDPANRKRVLAHTFTCYDGDTTADCSQPPTRGLATLHRAWDDREGHWVTTSTTYDTHGNPTATTDANRHRSSTTYDELGLHPVRSCNALQQCTTQLDWDRVADAPTLVVDPNGARTIYHYDELGRLAWLLTPSGARTTHHYRESDAGAEDNATTPLTGHDPLIATTLRDGLDRIIRTSRNGPDDQPGPQPATITVHTEYADASPLVYRSPFRAPTPTLPRPPGRRNATTGSGARSSPPIPTARRRQPPTESPTATTPGRSPKRPSPTKPAGPPPSSSTGSASCAKTTRAARESTTAPPATATTRSDG